MPYRARISRALLDRFDLVVQMPRPRASELAAPPGESTEVVAGRVAAAAERLRERSSPPAPPAVALLDRAVDRLPLSGRGRARVLRVSATVAALAGAPEIRAEHVAEALSYRTPAELGGAV